MHERHINMLADPSGCTLVKINSAVFFVELLEEKTIVFAGSTCTEYIGFL